MAMTPQDIQAQQFNVRLRGFDMAEVDAFLEEVAENIFHLIQENNQLHDQVQLLEKYRQDSISKEAHFKDAIIAAQKVADEMRERSSREAEALLTKARDESATLRQRLEQEQAQRRQALEQEQIGLEAELGKLRGLRDTIRQELRAVLRSYLDQLDDVLPAGAAAPSASDPDDLSDLYQKIDLPAKAFGGIIRGCSDQADRVADTRRAGAEKKPDMSTVPRSVPKSPPKPEPKPEPKFELKPEHKPPPKPEAKPQPKPAQGVMQSAPEPRAESDGPKVHDALFSLDATAASDPEPAVTFSDDDLVEDDMDMRPASR